MKFTEIREFFPHLDLEQLIILYSIYGGVPYYLELLGNGQNPLEKSLTGTIYTIPMSSSYLARN